MGKKLILLTLNGLALIVSMYYSGINDGLMEQLSFNFEKIRDGFQAIDNAYFDSLTFVNRSARERLANEMIKKVENDSLRYFLERQKSIGEYYVHYQDAIGKELGDVSFGINLLNHRQRFLFWIILALCLVNIFFVFIIRN